MTFRRTEPKKQATVIGGWVNEDAIRLQRFDFGSFTQPRDKITSTMNAIELMRSGEVSRKSDKQQDSKRVENGTPVAQTCVHRRNLIRGAGKPESLEIAPMMFIFASFVAGDRARQFVQ